MAQGAWFIYYSCQILLLRITGMNGDSNDDQVIIKQVKLPLIST